MDRRTSTRRAGAVVVLACMTLAACAAILGREDLVFESTPAEASAADVPATGDGAVSPDDGSVLDAGADVATCPGVDASCTSDASNACCSGLECRNARCSPCIAENQSCGSSVRCCGTTLRCKPNIPRTCVQCLEAGVPCEITEPQMCCSGNCSPATGCMP